jgi:integrase
MAAKANLRLVKPAIQKRAVAPRRRPNSEFRSREHLTETEVEKLIDVTKDNRYGHRDATMFLVAYRHGLRASEICDLRWEQIDFTSATLHVGRVKNGKPSTHPIRGDELRALRKLQREAPKSPFVFVSERGGPFTGDSFNWMVKRAGQKADFPFQVHAHMLRHATGYKLAGVLMSISPSQGRHGHACRPANPSGRADDPRLLCVRFHGNPQGAAADGARCPIS